MCAKYEIRFYIHTTEALRADHSHNEPSPCSCRLRSYRRGRRPCDRRLQESRQNISDAATSMCACGRPIEAESTRNSGCKPPANLPFSASKERAVKGCPQQRARSRHAVSAPIGPRPARRSSELAATKAATPLVSRSFGKSIKAAGWLGCGLSLLSANLSSSQRCSEPISSQHARPRTACQIQQSLKTPCHRPLPLHHTLRRATCLLPISDATLRVQKTLSVQNLLGRAR